jgi:ligand-binding sensor domain-containing protein/two-component sensor histidine kinase
MHNSFITILVCLLTAITNPVKAQQQVFKNYTVNDGLVSNTIRRIFQDDKGFLWAATVEGISKYDGYQFTNYSTSNGLSHNIANDFFQIKDGQLLVALNDGNINIITDDKIIIKPGIANSSVNRFIKSPFNKIVVTTDRQGLQEYNNGKFIKPVQPFSNESYADIIWLNDSLFIALAANGIQLLNSHYDLVAQNKNNQYAFGGSKIFMDSKKRIWNSTPDGVMLIDLAKKKENIITLLPPSSFFDIPFLKKAIVNDIFEDASGTMWFATSQGVAKINTDGSQQIFTVKDGLPSNVITCIFQDKEKNIWLGTASGLSKLISQQNINFYPVEAGLYQTDYLYLLYPLKKNNFLVGTNKGISIFNKINKTFTAVSNTGSQFFFNVVTNSNPPLFFGSSNMATVDTVKNIMGKQSALPLLPANRIITDSQGNIFLSNLSQLYFISGKNKEKIFDDRITSMLLDKDNCLWASTWQNGIFRIKYNFINNKFTIIKTEHFLINEHIRNLFQDSKGNIWAGTRYEGVYKSAINKAGDFTFTNFNQSSGLTSNFIKGVREDEHGNFWVAFYQGIDKLIPEGENFRIFNFSRINNYFASIIGIETDDNHSLWLATNEGLVQINDGELEKLPPLQVYITKVFTPDSVYNSGAKKIALNYQQNQLQFEFAAPGYINEKQLMYSYRLSGDDNVVAAWSKTSNQHTVSYASLKPGSYTFEVRSLGWNGSWGVSSTVEFSISPPFWQSWWFITILSLLLLSIIYSFIKWREKNIKTIAAEKLKVQQLNAEQYKSKLELEQIINYFSSSLIDKNTVDDVLWDVAKNLIGRLGFADCILYLWNADKTAMVQKAGFGPKGSVEKITKQPFDVLPGQGVVGFVMQSKEPVVIADTSKDSRYRPDEMIRLSEITVPIIYNNELIGVIDSEYPGKDFFTTQHLHILSTIATLMGNKLKSIEAEQSLQQSNIEMYSMNEQLLKAKLEALRSQMNPHFIFNALNAIDNLIQTNQKDKATTYLARFAKLIRNVLDSSKNNVIAFQKDYETLELYLQLEQFRCSDKFSYELFAENELLHSDYKVPPLIVQPFVENAIHHGLLNKQEGNRRLTVTARLDNDCIKYTVCDNGVGRAKAQQLKEINRPGQQSYGIDITTERIQLFNQNGETNNVVITDLYENDTPSGTKVEISVKIL